MTSSYLILGLLGMGMSSQQASELPPRIFEPPEARSVLAEYEVDCAAYNMNILYQSTSVKSSVKAVSFSGKAVSAAELSNINTWLSHIRGNALIRVFCGIDGAEIVFVEAFTRDRNPPRAVQIRYIDQKFELAKKVG